MYISQRRPGLCDLLARSLKQTSSVCMGERGSVCVCMCVCMCMYAYVYEYICMYMDHHILICMCVSMCVYI